MQDHRNVGTLPFQIIFCTINMLNIPVITESDLIRISAKRIRAYLDTIISMYFCQLMLFLNLLLAWPYLVRIVFLVSLFNTITRPFVIDLGQISGRSETFLKIEYRFFYSWNVIDSLQKVYLILFNLITFQIQVLCSRYVLYFNLHTLDRVISIIQFLEFYEI